MRQLHALLFLPLAACTVATSDAAADRSSQAPATCRNEALGQFTGEAAGQELGERMLRATGARILRWVPKGGMVTMDFSPERITIFLDESNRVERASCG